MKKIIAILCALAMLLTFGVQAFASDNELVEEKSEACTEYKQPKKFWDYAQGRMERNGMFVDMEEFLKSSMCDADGLCGKAGIINDTVVMEIESNTVGKLSLVGSLKEDTFLVNGYNFYVRRPFMAVDEYNWETYTTEKKVYVNSDVLKYMFGCQIQAMTIYLIDENGLSLNEPEYYFELVRPNMGYVETATE